MKRRQQTSSRKTPPSLWQCLMLGMLLSVESAAPADGVRGTSAAERKRLAAAAEVDEDFSSSEGDGDDYDLQQPQQPQPQNIMMQAEDYIIMQMEIAWGMNEMNRYKNLRGGYPTRSASLSILVDDDKSEAEREESDYLDEDRYPHSTTSNVEDPSVVSVAANTAEDHQSGSGGTSVSPERNDRSSTDSDHNETDVVEDNPAGELALIVGAKTARTVEEYWDSLVSLF